MQLLLPCDPVVPLCALVTVAMITVIMMMMTVTVMSINRPVGGRSPRAGFKNDSAVPGRTHTRTHARSFDIMSHWKQIISSSSSPSPLFSSALTASCHSASENHSQVTASLHHAYTLTSVLFPSLATLRARPLYLSVLSFLCISELSPSPVSLPLPICLTLSLSHLFYSPMG